MKILIVDDKKENLIYMESLLNGSGYEVTSSVNGKDALKKLRKESFNMIISDILMPEMDGFQLLKNVKDDNNLKNIPFIFYTSTYISNKDRKLGLKLGVDEYIQKPFDPEKFIKLIQGIIRDVESGKFKPKKPKIKTEKEVFKLYSERLVQKLEKKMLDLERKNTEFKRKEQALRESEKKFRNVIDSTPVGIAITTLEGKVIELNPAILDIFGYNSKEELIEMSVSALYYDLADRERFIKAFSKGVVRDFVAKFKRKNGSVFLASLTSINQITEDGSTQIINIVKDITEQRQAELSLRERLKELECLYGLTKVSEKPGMTLEKLFQEVVNLLPLRWQYPELTGGCITFKKKIYKTDNFRKTKWLQSCDIYVKNEVVGKVEICYLKEKPDEYEGPFFKEERNLINEIAKQLGLYVQRERANERDVHLNRLLRAIRKVNKLIIKEKNQNKLIEVACEILVKTRGYDSTWIILLDHSGKFKISAEAGIGDDFNSLIELYKKGTLPPCGQKTLNRPDVLVINNPEADCSECPLIKIYPDNKRITSRLKHNGKNYGLMGVSVPPELILDEEERHLAKEAVEDISFALYNLEMEKERNQWKEKLIKNQYYLTKAQEMGLIGTWELDIKKNILVWTDENYKIFGVPPGTEMNYNLFLNCVHPDDRDYIHEKWSAGLNKEPYDVEHRVIVKDKVKWVREKADIEFDTDGNPVMAIGFTQDITERKRIEEELKKHQGQLEDLVKQRTAELVEKNIDLEHFHDATIDREFRMKELNDRIAELEAELKKRS